MLNGVHSGFVDFKKKNWATDSGVKPLALESEDLQELWLKFLDDDVGNFSTSSL